MAFSFTAKQQQAQTICAGDASHVMLYGGSRSGKTLLHVRNTVMRALKAPGSRHLIARYRFNQVKTSIVYDTFPRVMSHCFPGVPADVSKSDWYWKGPNESEIWFAGLDDKERTEKVLGNEYVTLLLNECSQISWTTREMLVTRLAQKVEQKIQGRDATLMRLRAFYDCNPTSKAHWTYRLFKQKVDPETKEPLRTPDNFAAFQMNPQDNIETSVRNIWPLSRA
jgi:phage terminase large subunit